MTAAQFSSLGSAEKTTAVAGNTLTIFSLKNIRVISETAAFLNSLHHKKVPAPTIVLNVSGSVFPNVCVPLCGMFEEYIARGHSIAFSSIPTFLQSCSFPWASDFGDKKEGEYILNKIWRFNRLEDVHAIVDAITEEIQQVVVCENGVLQGLQWSLNEVMDNVIQHSGKSYGFVMAQIHKRTKHIALCVFDSGKGIYESLRTSVHKPETPLEALKISVMEGITRDKKIGQGNGLWGLYQIVTENRGNLSLFSGGSALISLKNNTREISNLPVFSGTAVDFQLNYEKEISISNALGGYEPVNIRIEKYEVATGHILFKLKENASGYGTRKAGILLRNQLINFYKESGSKIIIDFDEIAIVSSSFADELIGKLVSEFGFYAFNNIFQLINMNLAVQTVVQRSVAMRMIESYQAPQSGEPAP